MERLYRELGVERLMVEGGGGANGAFLRAGLLDEFSLILSPVDRRRHRCALRVQFDRRRQRQARAARRDDA